MLTQSQVITPQLGFGTDTSGRCWVHLTPQLRVNHTYLTIYKLVEPRSTWQRGRGAYLGKAWKPFSWQRNTDIPTPLQRTTERTQKRWNYIPYLCRAWNQSEGKKATERLPNKEKDSGQCCAHVWYISWHEFNPIIRKRVKHVIITSNIITLNGHEWCISVLEAVFKENKGSINVLMTWEAWHRTELWLT